MMQLVVGVDGQIENVAAIAAGGGWLADGRRCHRECHGQRVLTMVESVGETTWRSANTALAKRKHASMRTGCEMYRP
jgi:hypothetical protein